MSESPFDICIVHPREKKRDAEDDVGNLIINVTKVSKFSITVVLPIQWFRTNQSFCQPVNYAFSIRTPGPYLVGFIILAISFVVAINFSTYWRKKRKMYKQNKKQSCVIHEWELVQHKWLCLHVTRSIWFKIGFVVCRFYIIKSIKYYNFMILVGTFFFFFF